MLYFDHNATAPLHPAAMAAWLDAQGRFPANPSSQHRMGKRADVALDAAREFVAAHLGCPPSSVTWTSGATEAANAVFSHLSRALNPHSQKERPEVWISAVEHPCVRDSAARYFPGRVRELPVNAAGELVLEELGAALLEGKPAGVAVMAANNETGVLQPWEEAHALCCAAGVPLICDATQWVGRLPMRGMGAVDFVFGSGHKMGAPVGVGFLKAPDPFQSFLSGGPQEDGRRPGTQNVAAAAAFVAALKACEAQFLEIPERLQVRRDVEKALVEFLPGVQIIGAESGRLWNTIALMAPELADCRQRWVVRLDAAEVAASSGSACASGMEKPSHVLASMGVPAGASDRVLRLSCGWDCAVADWTAVVQRMVEVYKRWR